MYEAIRINNELATYICVANYFITKFIWLCTTWPYIAIYTGIYCGAVNRVAYPCALVSEMRTLVKSFLLLTALVYRGTQGQGKPLHT